MKENKNIDIQASPGGEKWPNHRLVVMDSMEEAIALVKSNPVCLAYKNWNNDLLLEEALRECLKEISEGNPEISKEIAEKSEKWKGMVWDLVPSLNIKRNWSAAENSDVWDAGKIAQGEGEPCFLRSRQSDQVNPGAGDGAYRIIISTDVHWAASPVDGAAVMGALCLILQEFAPVEIWIQQGWGSRWGKNSNDGVTLIPAFRGGVFNPQLLSFWTGSKYKDNVFSCYLNFAFLGRTSNGVCVFPQLPCDLFMSSCNIPMPCKDEWATAWIADVVKQVLFEEKVGLHAKGARNLRYD